MLNGAVALHDIRDAEAFVIDTVVATGLRLSDDEREELTAEGLAILCRMAQKYEPRRGGHTQDGRFSGYAARYLRGKILDAWHALHPEHLSVRSNGQRGRTSGQPALSLQGLMYAGVGHAAADTAGDEGPGREYRAADKISALAFDDPLTLIDLGGRHRMTTIGTIANASSALIRRIHSALTTRVEHEINFTVQVAVLKGMDLPRAEIETTLDASEIQVRAAMDRLRAIGLDLGTT